MSESRNNKTLSGSVLLGLFLILLGIGFILDTLNIFEFGSFLGTWWPSLIIVFSLISLLIRASNLSSLFVILLIFVPVQLAFLNKLPDNFWSLFWPVFLIVIGLRIVFTKFVGERKIEDSDDFVNSTVLMGGNDIVNSSKTFKGGEVTAIAGGIKLDLRNADIQNQANLTITAVMGGVELFVPKDWSVIVKGMPIMGGWDNKAALNPESIKVLKITGTAIMGGIDIKN